MISSPVDYEQIRRLEELLVQVNDLRLKLVGSSAKEGVHMVVSAEQPIPLLKILSDIELVESVSEIERGFDITLKAT